MATINEYNKKYGKISVSDVFAVVEDGVIFKTADGRFVEGCVGQNGKSDGVVRVSAYPESWIKWLDMPLHLPNSKSEYYSEERVVEARKSIDGARFIADFQKGSFGVDPYNK